MQGLKLGVQQGRLSPRRYPLLQSFPWSSWRQEFHLAKTLGLPALEWLFTDERYCENPIWTNEGRKQILKSIRDTGVTVPTVCAAFFVNQEFYSADSNRRKLFDSTMRNLICFSAELGSQTILLPVLEEASPDSPEKRQMLLEYLDGWEAVLDSAGISLGLEADLAADEVIALATEASSGAMGVYYDLGNATASGFSISDDIQKLSDLLLGIHIKDRKLGGPSVFLGEGDVDLNAGLMALIQAGWSGYIVFESYFEDDPMKTMRSNIEIVNRALLMNGQN